MKSPILGSSYVARSVNAADNVMINLFPEATPDGGKTSGYLNRCPGLNQRMVAGVGPIRGMWVVKGVGYIVSGSELYTLSSATDYPVLVTLFGVPSIEGTGPVSMADNGLQVFIACGAKGYIYTIASGVLEEITTAAFLGATTVTYLNSYFIFNQPNTQKIWVTSPFDGLTIDVNDNQDVDGASDNLVAIIEDHRELWMFGTNSLEVWYYSGNVDFPFERIQGAVSEIGCAATFSVAKLDNTLYWLGSDARGSIIVYKASGYSGQRVSTHAVEFAMQGYTSVSDAIAYSYQQEGHSFYVLTFPTDNVTWVYDVATGAWHQRASFVDGGFVRHRSNCRMALGGLVFVGDYENGNLYSFDMDVYSDAGDVQKYVRSWRALPTGQNNLKRTVHHSLQIDCETGVGISGTDQGSDPVMLLRWSDNGGHTWSNYHSTRIGAFGEFNTRAIWYRLGMTTGLRDRVYEISGTDPTKIAIMGAELTVSGSSA